MGRIRLSDEAHAELRVIQRSSTQNEQKILRAIRAVAELLELKAAQGWLSGNVEWAVRTKHFTAVGNGLTWHTVFKRDWSVKADSLHIWRV